MRDCRCHSPACLVSPFDKFEKLRNFTAFNSRYRMPSKESGGSANMWYSFNIGPVHFVSIDTESQEFSDGKACIFSKCGGFSGEGGRDMIEWLQLDLAEANRHRTVRPWVVVGGHRPMYQGKAINHKFQAAVEDLFHNFSVDVYFSGHVHSYERDYPVYQGVVQKGATTHIMVGGAGNAEMHSIKHSQAIQAQRLAAVTEKQLEQIEKLHNPAPPSRENGSWTAVVDQDYYGIGLVEANLTALRFDYVRTATREVFDTVVLRKDGESR